MDSDNRVEYQDGQCILTEATILTTPTPILPPFTSALMYCNRQMATEATAIFYRRNTFQFLGHETWQPMYRWLSLIGEEKRAHLRHLRAEMHFPYQLAQDWYGSHRFHGCPDIPWPFHRVERTYASSPRPPQAVEYISPAIEACFRILGQAGPALTLRLILPRGVLPGVSVWYEGWDSMAIPEQVEKSRTEFTARRVIVLWEGVGLRPTFLQQRATILAQGWEIIEEREGPPPSGSLSGSGLPTTLFTVQKAPSLT
jgi:hypothetical protein